MLSVIGFLALLFVITFLLGSIPWGVIISRVFYHTDIREHGSGNIGTTNAMRTMGKVGGGAVFVLDFGKGIISGLVALAFSWYIFTDPTSVAAFSDALGGEADPMRYMDQICLSLAFLACAMGHIFSPWLHFKGGKGVAVAAGCLFSTFGLMGGLIELALFAILVIVTRYVSVGSIGAAILCPFLAVYFFWGNPVAIGICLLVACLVVWAHRENIGRLRAGCENRIGSKKKSE